MGKVGAEGRLKVAREDWQPKTMAVASGRKTETLDMGNMIEESSQLEEIKCRITHSKREQARSISSKSLR